MRVPPRALGDGVTSESDQRGCGDGRHGPRGTPHAGLGVVAGRCYPLAMNALKAHVKNGQIVLDEPVELPEGAEADVLVHVADPHDQMDEQERAELLQAIDEGLADVDAGEVYELKQVIASLGTRT